MDFRLKDKIFLSVFFIIFALIIAGKFLAKPTPEPEPKMSVKVGLANLKVEEVFTDISMYKGLGSRENLPQDQGMLFLHESAAKHKYVMRDMKFPLDFIFINDDKVVDVAENVSTDYKGTIAGATDYDKVLEVNAGFVAKNNIQLGDEFKIISD